MIDMQFMILFMDTAGKILHESPTGEQLKVLSNPVLISSSMHWQL